MPEVQLTKHFSLYEATYSNTAIRLQIDNQVPINLMGNLLFSAQQLEGLRLEIDKPFLIDSWFRCSDLNKAVGGTATSDHMQALAIDIRCPELGIPLELSNALLNLVTERNLPWDQIIHEFGHWCHISFHPEDKGRKETWTYFPDNRGHMKGLWKI